MGKKTDRRVWLGWLLFPDVGGRLLSQELWYLREPEEYLNLLGHKVDLLRESRWMGVVNRTNDEVEVEDLETLFGANWPKNKHHLREVDLATGEWFDWEPA